MDDVFEIRIDFAIIIFFLIGMVIIAVVFLGLIIHKDNARCKEKGFEFSKTLDYIANGKEIEEGYLHCCNKTYINHLRVDDSCTAVKVE